MITIRAVYKIPEVRHVFFIFDTPDMLCEDKTLLPGRKQRMEYFERILKSKGHKDPIETRQWQLKVVNTDDFVSAIEQHKPRERISSSQSSINPDKLERLTINLLESPSNILDWTFETPKCLSDIPEEDIIEVFI